MMNNTDRFDDIDQYVTDKMSPSERESFLNDVRNDASLNASLHLVEEIQDGLRRRSEKIDKITEWEQSRKAQIVQRKRVALLSSVSVAAAVIVGVFISYPKSYYGLQDLGFKSELSVVIRGSADYDIVQAWKSGEYEECLAAIREEIALYESAIDNLDVNSLPIEEFEGKLSEYMTEIDDLSWASIQTLLKMRRYDDALAETEDYLQRGGKRIDKATKLQNKLIRKLNK